MRSMVGGKGGVGEFTILLGIRSVEIFEVSIDEALVRSELFDCCVRRVAMEYTRCWLVCFFTGRQLRLILLVDEEVAVDV